MGTRAERAQFQGIFNQVYTYVGAYDLASEVDAAGITAAYTIPGVVLGDHVISWSIAIDLAGITATAYVSAADTVTIRFQNESGGTLNLASAQVSILVGRPNKTIFQ